MKKYIAKVHYTTGTKRNYTFDSNKKRNEFSNKKLKNHNVRYITRGK